jgi:hypothetical protein
MLFATLEYDGQRQKKHLFPISFVSLNSLDFYTSHWPEKWGDLTSAHGWVGEDSAGGVDTAGEGGGEDDVL